MQRTEQSLRKVFADLDQRRDSSKAPPAAIIPTKTEDALPPRPPPKIRRGDTTEKWETLDEVGRTLQDPRVAFRDDTAMTTEHGSSGDAGVHWMYDSSREETDDGAAILDGSRASPPSAVAEAEPVSDSNRTFDSILEEQRSKEKQLEARKECTFRRVLSALGGPAMDSASLPPDVLLAWETRNEKIAIAEEKAKQTQQKLKVRCRTAVTLSACCWSIKKLIYGSYSRT